MALVLKNPAIWARLDSSFITNDPSIADICVQRSIGEKLDVVLDTSDGLTACLAVLSTAVPHASRWRSFAVRSLCDAGFGRHNDAMAILDAIEASCRGVVLAALENLNLEFSFDMIYGFDCASWTMPNLRRLSTCNFAPSGIFTSLRSFHMHLNFLFQPQVVSYLLIHAPGLETLSLEFVDFVTPPLEPCSRVIHWGIKFMQLRVVNTKWPAMKPFYESLKFPRLRRMQISLLDFDGDNVSATLFVAKLVPDPQWSRVNVLDLHVTSKCGGPYYLEIPFQKLAHLEIFSLRTDHHLMRSNLWPPLLAFQITESENVTQMWLEDSIKDMRQRGVRARMRIVSISNCYLLDRNTLEGIVGRGLILGQSLTQDELINRVQRPTTVVPWAGKPLVRLPIEVLEVVLQSAVLGFQPSGRYKCASRLAGVSSTFRKAMLSMPTLWTDIHSSAAANNPMAVYTGIKRSMGLGLHITLKVVNGAQACADLLEIAAPHSHRWHSFRLHDSPGSSDTKRVITAMSDFVGNIQLPQLRNLYLNYDFARGRTWAEMLAAGTSWEGHLYKSWLAPNLISLSCSGVIPVPLSHARSLTKFDFFLTTGLNYQKPRLLVAFLANVPSLEELSLFYMCFDPPANVLDVSATLPNLRKLSIRITDTNWESMSPIYCALKTPKLRDLHLRLQFLKHFSCMLDITTYLRNLLPDVNMCRLTGLYLNISVEEDPSRGFNECITLPLCESIIPHLTQLTVETNLRLLPSPEYPPPLTEIRIMNSHLVDIDWLSTLRTQMESIHTWNAVEVVEIQNCRSLLASKQDIHDLIPGERLLI